MKNINEKNSQGVPNYLNDEKVFQSPLEKRFYEDCRTVGLVVEAQHEIRGRYTIHVDFAVAGRKMAIEIDGKDYHRANDGQITRDNDRNKLCNSAGYSVFRIPGSIAYTHGEMVAESIKKLIYEDNVGIGVYKPFVDENEDGEFIEFERVDD